MAGRYKQPVDVLIAQGKKHLTKAEIEERREQEQALKPAANHIKCPSWLDKKTKKLWKQIAQSLADIGYMTNVDGSSLAVFCDAVIKHQEATQAMESEGLTIEYTNAGGSTNTVANPNIAIANKYAQIVKSFGAEFGLTPGARLRFVVPKTEREPTPFEKEFGDL